MKNRLKAILLATGLIVSLLGTGVYADEAVSEAAAEIESEVKEAEEAVSEALSELEEEAAESAEASDGKYAMYYDSIKESIPQTLKALSDMTPEQLDTIISDSQNPSEVALVSGWKDNREELGSFVEVTNQEITEDGNTITVISDAVYDGVDEKTKVQVEYEYDFRSSSASMSWEVKYPFGKLMQQAGLNTLMGMGIVFAVLIFLSFIISQLHWIPDLIEKGKKSKAPVPAAAPAIPAAVPAPAAAQEEEDLTDDLELAAVIAAAIAAYENTSADGFVVRSIRKANRRK